MSNITANADFDQVAKESALKWITIFAKDVVHNVNGNLDFQRNFRCKFVQVTFGTVNIETAITHGLGFVPTGYIPVKLSNAGSVFTGITPWTGDVIYLARNTAGTVTLLIF